MRQREPSRTQGRALFAHKLETVDTLIPKRSGAFFGETSPSDPCSTNAANWPAWPGYVGTFGEVVVVLTPREVKGRAAVGAAGCGRAPGARRVTLMPPLPTPGARGSSLVAATSLPPLVGRRPGAVPASALDAL